MTTLARWCIKKGARQSVAVLAGASDGLRGLMATSRRPSVHVLTYHRFGDARRDPFCVSEDVFAQQMAWLSEHGLALTLADVEAFLRGERELPEHGALVTIDDACPSVHARALPILRRYAVPAVLFVPAGELRGDDDAGGAMDESPDARMTGAQLRELADAGVTIGSHAWHHRSLARLSADDARDEAQRSRSHLESLIDRPVTAFAYPFGTRADFNASTRAILDRAGYTTAFTSQHGAVFPDTDPLTLPRIKIEGGEGLWMFRRLTRGGLDGWRWIDRTLWPLQAARA